MKGEPLIVKQLLQKAKESALLAIEYYNKPAISFKSEGFIVMICIAWTAFFHAYFFKNKIKPWYRKKEQGKRPRFEVITERLPDGNVINDKKWWDLQKCLKEFYKENNNDPVYKNIQFLYGLRNLIVHRNLPELDASIFAECQASVLNLNDYLKEYFGQKQRIDHFLSFSIQMFRNTQNIIEASKEELKKKNAIEIVDYIKSFRSAINSEILESPQYSFKAVLIQVKNHESKDALAIRFIHEKDLSEEQKKQLKNIGIVLIKDRKIKIPEDQFLQDKISYKDICQLCKDKIPSFKINQQFHKIRKEIVDNKPQLKYERKLDPANPKSPKKDYYDKKIVDLIIEKYEKLNAE